MNNLQFLRKKAGITTRQLSDLSGVSPAMICQLECGGRKFGLKSLDALSNALGVLGDFLEGKSDFGIHCDDGKKGIFLSKTEYLHQKRLGNIIESVARHEPYTESEIENMKEILPNDWERLIKQHERPFLYRAIITKAEQESGNDEVTALREEAMRLLQGMDKRQLEKALICIKEVILK